MCRSTENDMGIKYLAYDSQVSNVAYPRERGQVPTIRAAWMTLHNTTSEGQCAHAHINRRIKEQSPNVNCSCRLSEVCQCIYALLKFFKYVSFILSFKKKLYRAHLRPHPCPSRIVFLTLMITTKEMQKHSLYYREQR